MVELAHLLQSRLDDLFCCTVEPGIDDIIVMKNNDLVTPNLTEIIFGFAKDNNLNSYITVTFSGHIKFVLFKD